MKEGGERKTHAEIWRKSIPGEGKSNTKGFKVGICEAYSRNSQCVEKRGGKGNYKIGQRTKRLRLFRTLQFIVRTLTLTLL